MLKAPWTEEQVRNLNKYQVIGLFHPYTCGGKKDGKDCRADLIATKDGWICPEGCGYTQDWCNDFMANENVQEKSPFRKPGLSS